jgi:hypothetical protein
MDDCYSRRLRRGTREDPDVQLHAQKTIYRKRLTMHQCRLRRESNAGGVVWEREIEGECLSRRQMVSGVGVHFALEQCHDLLDNDVAGIHFYTLNRSDATRTIFDSVGIPRQRNTQVPIV